MEELWPAIWTALIGGSGLNLFYFKIRAVQPRLFPHRASGMWLLSFTYMSTFIMGLILALPEIAGGERLQIAGLLLITYLAVAAVQVVPAVRLEFQAARYRAEIRRRAKRHAEVRSYLEATDQPVAGFLVKEWWDGEFYRVVARDGKGFRKWYWYDARQGKAVQGIDEDRMKDFLLPYLPEGSDRIVLGLDVGDGLGFCFQLKGQTVEGWVDFDYSSRRFVIGRLQYGDQPDNLVVKEISRPIPAEISLPRSRSKASNN